jgi:predicted nucleotidyltransferase
VFRLDREGVVETLRRLAGALLDARPDVLEVRLFGSLARGAATPGSDADLWVLVRDGATSLPDRSTNLSRGFSGAGIGCDVLAYTEAEWERLRAEGRRIVRVVEEEAVVLADRRGSG